MLRAIREAYGQTLLRLGQQNDKITVLDADVSNSTRTVYFSQKIPQRFLNMGIAEANMVCYAAGLATLGYIPVVNTFSFLLCERALDQIRSSVAYNNLNVKFAANYGGMSDSFDGASHHSISDLAIIRSIPNMTLINISDAVMLENILDKIINYNGPVYFRLCRAETPVIYKENDNFEISKANILKDGKDVTIISTGIVLARALEAAEKLEQTGINAGVIDMHTIKPVDTECVLKAINRTKAVLTVEEANINGGLADAVSQIAANTGKGILDYAAIPDCFAQSGPYEDLLDIYGLSVDEIVCKCINLVEQKKKSGTIF